MVYIFFITLMRLEWEIYGLHSRRERQNKKLASFYFGKMHETGILSRKGKVRRQKIYKEDMSRLFCLLFKN